MRQRLFQNAARFGSSTWQQAGGSHRTFATKIPKAKLAHPTDKIPMKGTLPISSRNLRKIYFYGGSGLLVVSYVAYRVNSYGSGGKTAVGIAVETPWTTYTLESKDKVSPTAAIFTLKSQKLSAASYDGMFANSVWAVDIQQPQLQIVREYTPLPPALDAAGLPAKEGDTATLHLLIREEYKGEVSGYLHRLPLGANVEVSRPYAQVDLEREAPDSMVFVVGGTGITTALQAIHALLETKKGSAAKPSIHVLWANRKRDECLGGISDTPGAGRAGSWLGALPTWLGALPTWLGGSAGEARVEPTELGRSPIVDELRRLKEAHKGLVKVDYFVDEEGTFVRPEDVNRALAASAKPESTGSGKAFVAISGPDGFMVNLAGQSRELKNKVSERPTGGLLAELKQKDWKLMVLG